ncbi:BnaC05g51960D [Brassica napus]|uniref:BnaC05g51960D protein n=1 Tax=Brassica napus TaxID=3708 RepID=A0A078JP55_BRANA|nr:BnaC05g51960D [Brassica napus]
MLISSIDSTLRKRSRQERRDSSREKEASGFGFAVEVDPMGNESGYGSEPGYKGDVELGYGDEYDDEEEDVKLLFWGGKSLKLYNTSV